MHFRRNINIELYISYKFIIMLHKKNATKLCFFFLCTRFLFFHSHMTHFLTLYDDEFILLLLEVEVVLYIVVVENNIKSNQQLYLLVKNRPK